ncbi:hypothetical protein Lal_00013506 [Lupinus albus]|nr:hypothetical protein Lal_00013506 [Lupinus albus]
MKYSFRWTLEVVASTINCNQILTYSSFLWSFRFVCYQKHSRCSILKSLDKGLFDYNWKTNFDEAFFENLPKLHWDHCPILVRCGGAEIVSNIPFRFQAEWTSHAKFLDVVLHA